MRQDRPREQEGRGRDDDGPAVGKHGGRGLPKADLHQAGREASQEQVEHRQRDGKNQQPDQKRGGPDSHQACRASRTCRGEAQAQPPRRMRKERQRPSDQGCTRTGRCQQGLPHGTGTDGLRGYSVGAQFSQPQRGDREEDHPGYHRC